MSTQTQPNTLIAFDPGYDRLGVSVFSGTAHNPNLLFSTCITTDKKDAHHVRLGVIYKQASTLIETYSPTGLALETLYFAQNTTTALKVAEVRGVLLGLAGFHNLEVFEHTPQQVKLAVTGYGNAKKNEVIRMTQRLFPSISKKALDDEYDAVAVGLCALVSRKTQR